MPRPTKGPRLGSGPTHQKMMLGGLASQLIMHERIRTTETKAKRLRPMADRLVTLGKQGSVHARRQALSLIEDREVVHKLFADVAPRFAERNGGYTRVLKLGPRQGDAAPMAIIEFVEESVRAAPAEAEVEQRRRRGLRRRKPPKAAAAQDEGQEGGAETAEETEIEEEPGVLQGSPSGAAEAGEAVEEPTEPSPEAGSPGQEGASGEAETPPAGDAPSENS